MLQDRACPGTYITRQWEATALQHIFLNQCSYEFTPMLPLLISIVHNLRLELLAQDPSGP